MSDYIHFQVADKESFPELLAMMEEFYAIDGYSFQPDRAAYNLHHFVANEDWGRVWMIMQRTDFVGYVVLTFCFSFEFGGRTAFVDELFLKPVHRNKGIGGIVLDFIVQQAKALSLKALHLEVEPHNVGGNRLYTKKGFVAHKRSLMTKRIE